MKYATRQIEPRILQSLRDDGIDFLACSRGAVQEYNEEGFRIMLDSISRKVDETSARNGGAKKRAVELLSRALIADRTYVV